MKMQYYTLLILITTIIATPLYARHKGAVTQDKIKGSIFDLVREKNEIKADRDRLEAENTQLKSVSSSNWLLLNHSAVKVRLYIDNELLLSAVAGGITERAVTTMAAVEAGTKLKVELGDGKTVKVKLKPGKSTSLKTDDGKTVNITVDFLTGSRSWMILLKNAE